MGKPELIVMLTFNDHTVENAYEIFSECKDTPVRFWGMKEDGIPTKEMKRVFAYMKKLGKITVLEVVAYTENECLKGAEIADECGCDMLIGTVFFDSVNEFCKEKGIKYMPYVGKVSQRPSILEGNAEDMINEAHSYAEQGAYGINLLGYRHTSEPYCLSKRVVAEADVPLCLAGGINSYEILAQVKEISPWAFTIGSAFFEKRFGETFKEQIENVYNYIVNS